MINRLTVSISSLLLAATSSVRLARASLLMIGRPSSRSSKLFLSRNRRKQAAAIRLFPSINEWFFIDQVQQSGRFFFQSGIEVCVAKTLADLGDRTGKAIIFFFSEYVRIKVCFHPLHYLPVVL